MSGISKYVSQSYNELRNNVTWTPWSEAQRLTLVVVLFTIVFALIIYGIDIAFGEVISGYFSFIKG